VLRASDIYEYDNSISYTTEVELSEIEGILRTLGDEFEEGV